MWLSWSRKGPMAVIYYNLQFYLQYCNKMLAVCLRSRWVDEPSSVVLREKKWSSLHSLLAFQAGFFQAIFHRGLVIFFTITSVKYTLLVVWSTFFIKDFWRGGGNTSLLCTWRDWSNSIFFFFPPAVGYLLGKCSPFEHSSAVFNLVCYFFPLRIFQRRYGKKFTTYDQQWHWSTRLPLCQTP